MGFDCRIFNDTVASFSSFNTSSFPKVILADSMVNFKPRVEVQLSDNLGVIANSVGFVEGEEFTILYGDDLDITNQIQIKMYWEDNQIHDPASAECISGTSIMNFKHPIEIKDYPKARSFPQQIISNVVSQIIAPYVADTTLGSTFVEPTKNLNTWYQLYYQDYVYISEVLCKRAVSLQNPNEPFWCFIDLQNQLHFETLSNMFLRPPVAYLYLTNKNTDQFDDTTVQQYELIYHGVDKNIQNYNAMYYYISSTGAMLLQNKTIDQMPLLTSGLGLPRSTPGNLPQLSRNIINPQKHSIFGTIFNQLTDEDNYTGWINNQYRNQQGMIIFRLILRGSHPTIVAGSVINLDVPYPSIETAYKSLELSGNWVVFESKHFVNNNHVPFTEIYVMRNYVQCRATSLHKPSLL